MKSQGYWRIFIRIMRKDGFFVKGYPFDWTNSKTKIFHNHPLNLMKSGDFKNCKLFKSITRTKWYISLRLWWKKTGKVNSKFLGIQCLFISNMKYSNFKRKPFFVTSFWNWFYIGKSMFSEIYLKIFHWKSINFSVFRIQFSLCSRIFLIDRSCDHYFSINSRHLL